MASNSFGNLFRITTWGESHGKAIGVVIDGCPAGISLNEADIQEELKFRAPGANPYTSPRKEEDHAEILSGVFEGKTTGTPISIILYNKDVDTSKYEPIKDVLRPGHANYTYLKKYGIFDYRGGGRASGRETACRVAAGALAKKILNLKGIKILAYLKQISSLQTQIPLETISQENVRKSPLFCPDPEIEAQMISLLTEIKEKGDSVGGVVAFYVTGVPVGLGDPIYEKIEANLAKGLLSIPASKGFEIGSGFEGALWRGSQHNDPFIPQENGIATSSNHSGGLLGGITTGMPLFGKVAFKPPSSIQLPQKTTTIAGVETTLELPQGSRHDPCLAIRAVPVVEAMIALVLVDSLLLSNGYP